MRASQEGRAEAKAQAGPFSQNVWRSAAASRLQLTLLPRGQLLWANAHQKAQGEQGGKEHPFHSGSQPLTAGKLLRPEPPSRAEEPPPLRSSLVTHELERVRKLLWDLPTSSRSLTTSTGTVVAAR